MLLSLRRACPSLAALLLIAGGAAACQSNADKIAAFCTDFRAAVEQNKAACDQMGAALGEVFRKHEGVNTHGAADDEASKKALEDCSEAGRIIATQCAGNASVNQALQSLEDR